MSREDIDEMRRFRKIIENGFSADPWARVGGRPEGIDSSGDLPNVEPLDTRIDENNSNDADMVRFVSIIDDLYGSPKEAAKKLMEASIDNTEIAEAIDTRVTDNGVQIGKWQIRVRTDESKGKPKKYFDVRHSVSKQVVAKNLYLYEAALALVRYLNKGLPINSSEIVSLLSLERNYHAHRVDALTHKIGRIKAEKRGDSDKAFVLENRYGVSVAKARKLEEQIKKIADSII